MQKYTLTVLVNEKVSEADRNATFEALKKHFGTLIKEDLWGMRSLSYEIKHANKAFFAFFEFEAEPTAIISLDKSIRLNEDIIRYLIVKVKEKRVKVKSTPKKSEEKQAEIPVEVLEEKEGEKKEEKKKAKAKK